MMLCSEGFFSLYVLLFNKSKSVNTSDILDFSKNHCRSFSILRYILIFSVEQGVVERDEDPSVSKPAFLSNLIKKNKMPSIEEDGKDVDVDNVTRPFDFALRFKDNGSRTVIK